MANTKSAAKALRVSERRHLRNKSAKSAVKTFVRKAEQSIASRAEQTVADVRAAISALDRAAEKTILHPNNSARRKSRLMKKLNVMTAAMAAAPVAAPEKAAPKRATRARAAKKA